MKFKNSVTDQDNQEGLKLLNVKNPKILNITTFIIKIITSCIYCFLIGYFIYTNLNIIEIKELFLQLIKIPITLIPLWFLVLLIHEVVHYLFSPYNTRYFVYNLKKLSFSYSFQDKVSIIRIVIILLAPILLLTIIPTLYIIFKGFNIFIFYFTFINTIHSINDLFSIFLLSKDVEKSELIKIENNNIYILNDIDATIDIDNNTNDVNTSVN